MQFLHANAIEIAFADYDAFYLFNPFEENMFICQLIIEEVRGCPTDAPNQFKNQINPVGEVADQI